MPLYISEYSASRDEITLASAISIAEQRLTIGASSVQSANLNAKTRYVRLKADAVCSVAIGANPTATVNNARLAASASELMAVSPEAVAAGLKVAVIQNS